MAYSEFTLAEVARRFSLAVVEEVDLFPDAPEAPPSDFPWGVLAEYAPLALSL